MWAGAGECLVPPSIQGEKMYSPTKSRAVRGKCMTFYFEGFTSTEVLLRCKVLKVSDKFSLSLLFCTPSKLKVIAAAVSKFSQSLNFFQILTDLTIIISPNGEILDRNMKTLNFRFVVRFSWSITRAHASVRVSSQRPTACLTRYHHVYRVSPLTRVMSGLV